MGRRWGDGQLGREDTRQGGSWRTRVGKAAAGRIGWWLVDSMRQWIADWVVLHLSADKLGGTTRE